MQTAPAARQSRRRLRLALVLVVALLGLWSVLWLVAAHETEGALSAWMENERKVGRVWSCPQQQVAGYPFGITVSCHKPRFEGLAFGHQAAGGLGGFEAHASILAPRHIEAFLASPLAARGAGVDATLTWQDLRLDMAGFAQRPNSLAVLLHGVGLTGAVSGLGPLAGSAETLEARASDAGEEEHRYAFDIVMDGAAHPALDTFLGGPAKASIAVAGTMTQADFATGGSPADRLERWRAAGGRVEIGRLALSAGPTTVVAHGTLGLDAEHRLQGRLDTETTNIEPVLQRLGVDPALVTAGSLLTHLLGARANPQGAAALKLAVRFDGGFVSIGPVRLNLRLPPFY